MLSEDVRTALQIELRQLQETQARIAKKIDGLAAVLADEDAARMVKPAPKKRGNEAGVKRSTGLSQSIRTLLGQVPTGMRTSEIMSALVSVGGFVDSESFRRGVNSELWRQKKAKKIRKVGRKYTLVTETKSEAVT
jgi:hypothetical protein